MFKKGTVVKAKELVGMKDFQIGHMPTFIDDVHSVKWFSSLRSAVVINYNDYQTVTVSANEVYIAVGENRIAYESMAWEFLGRGWREKYPQEQ